VTAVAALERLEGILPLAARQASLPPALRTVHRAILAAFAERGAPPAAEGLVALTEDGDLAGALARLAADDLVVLDAAGGVAGAYPFTLEGTPHRVIVHGHTVNAMCALDAVAVAPMFDCVTTIDSRCHVSGTPVRIRMDGARLLEAQPSPDLRVGIRWRSPQVCAAHSLCREMVFLGDAAVAAQWQGDVDAAAVLDLEEAVALGAAFFRPLVSG
jgi:mercuric reductase